MFIKGSNPGVIRFFVLNLASALMLPAQLDTATITGVVTDSTGAAVVGAAVRAVNKANGIDHRTATNQAGLYVLTALPVGTYELEIGSSGFQTIRRPNVTLNAGTRANVDAALQVGQVNEVVEVTAEVPLLESQTSDLGQVIENKTITQMPLNGRNYQELAMLATGVLPNRTQNFVEDGFSVNGASFDQNVFVLDGADNNNYFSGVVVASNQAVKPSIDAIQEFKMETHNYGAEFGRGGGAVVQTTIRSGTNQFHGTLFEFLRNDKLDANNFFNSGRRKPPYRQNQFGGTLGGPVVRDRLFFFGSYEGTRIREQITTQSTVPTPQQIGGNFSGVAAIYDPATQSGTSRRPFPGNLVPRDRFDALASRQLGLYPAPNIAGRLNFVFNSPRNRDDDKVDTKVDWRKGNSHNFFVRYSYLTFDRLEPGNLPLPASGGNTAVRFSRAHSGVFSWTSVLPGATKVNEMRLAYNRLVGGIDTPTKEQLWKEFGFRGTFDRSDINGLPLFQPAGYQNIGDRSFAPDPRKQDVRQFTDTFSWNAGKHAMKMGANLRNFVRWSGITNFSRGVYSFNGQFTRSIAGGGTGGDSIADSLLGLTSNAQLSNAQDARRHGYSYEFFFQDDFKATGKLTLNLGLRWEYQSPYVEQNNRVANFVIDTADPKFGSLLTGPIDNSPEGRTFRKRDFNNWGPRIGFAYQVTGKTVIRGGYGLFYVGDFALSATQSIYANAPWYLQTDIPTASTAATSNLIVARGFAPDALNPNAIAGKSLFASWFPFSFPIGSMNQWNINLQRQLPWNSLVSVAYVGSNTIHLPNDVDLNQPAPGPGGNNPRRWFPQYAALPTRNPIMGGSNYQGLEMKFERRFNRGVSVLTGYTFSKTLVRQPQQRTDRFSLAPEKTLSQQHMPQRFFLAGVWDLPFGKGRKWSTEGVAAAILGGWQISPIVTLQSGLPFSPGVAGNPANTTGGQRPDRLRDGNLPKDQRTPQRWFDVGAFAVQAPFTFGNSAAWILQGPGNNNLDVMIARTFRFKERYSFDFRTELFNLTNTAHFNFPNATVNNANAGAIGSTVDSARQIQFGLKFIF